MGKILTSYLPFIYHTEPNDVYNFIDALELSVDFLRAKCAKLPDLANVDKCPTEYLSYLARTTDALLMGENPDLWRNQIRKWPEILSIKGTEKSVKLLLSAMGFVRFGIKTYWRDADGNYTTEKPEGEPFKGVDGIWYNCRTHYFSITVYWTEGSDVGSEPDTETLNFAKKWLPRVKPIYAELLAWEVGLGISESYDTLSEDFSTRYCWGLSDRITMTDEGHEAFSVRISVGLSDYVWKRHYYSDEGLAYTTSGIAYGGTDGDIEHIHESFGTGIADTVTASDGKFVSTLKVIIK